MASKLSAFLKQNKKAVEEFDFKLDSFDEPIRMRIISGRENEQIQKRSMVTIKRGRRTTQELDSNAYTRNLVIKSIVVPDLENIELQESYGVAGATELYHEMFNFAEQTLLAEKIMVESGLDQTIEDDVEEAKN